MKKKILSFSLVISILCGTFFQCLFPVCVCALSLGGLQSTVASIIISLMLECGVAPVNNSWLQTLNTSYGVTSSIGTIQDCINSGLLTQSGTTLIDTGLSAAIESASAYSDLGLAEIFTTTADDVALGVVAGSGGVNLATIAINVGTLGTIGAYAGAVGVGVGLGVLINHLREKFVQNIGSGVPIDYTTYVNGIPKYTPWYKASISDGRQFIYTYEATDVKPVLFGRYNYGGNTNFQVTGLEGSTRFQIFSYNVATGNRIRENGGTTAQGATRTSTIREQYYIDSNYPLFETNADYETYKNAVLNGDLERLNPFYARDLIGNNGNQRLDGNDEPSDIKNVIPEGYDMKPISPDAYNDFVEQANDNTDNGETGVEQGDLFDNFIDNLLVAPSVIPNQGVTDPEVPDRPIIPDQPEVPGKDPITGEQQSDVLEGITTPDLRSVFPFCIPFDLYNILGVMKYEGREAPVIVWEFEFLGNSYPVIIDLSPYDDVAALLRLLELLLFIVGLAVATRNLIGAGG